MEREIVVTGDGSSTIHLPEWDEQYHSKHGAIQEAYHVFIKHGLQHFYNFESDKSISILEIGFGTGLNTFITLLEAEKLKLNIHYCGVEGYPVLMEEINQLNYSKELQVPENDPLFKHLHEISWNEKNIVTPNFSLIKQHKFFNEIEDIDAYNIIYFDAFGARVQPELWTEAIFKKMYDALKNSGVLVTYSAKGSVRRAMQAVGFEVERLPGPPGKREMLRATKHSVISKE
ncbi:tRNA (5-methylaminomethyl-2-thiouridine)(34)-methyltransferase MnmD [Thalassobellus sediminis]|uniref:tRNA (5-methylaminomethyl-2-thiouridine)(34)-methyltransferase MnmD n=1 Tax=Thalassobellus sediminis TaxID=3367753 RepID=UPI0037BB9776